MTHTHRYPTLRKGSRRPHETRELVRLLALRGYTVDARCSLLRVGDSIVNAVCRFQGQNLRLDGRPLAVDGIVGPQTWAALQRPAEDAQHLGFRGRLGHVQRGTPVYRVLLKALQHHRMGVREDPMGSNCVPQLEARAQGKPWCSFWVHNRIRKVLGQHIFRGRRGSTRMDLKQAAARDLIVSDPRPGDVFLLCRNGRPYHTGFVLATDREHMDTVEGNCANRVAIRRRRIDGDVIFWRPFPGDLRWTPGLLPEPVRAAGGEGTR